jgi:hypothetical protein
MAVAQLLHRLLAGRTLARASAPETTHIGQLQGGMEMPRVSGVLSFVMAALLAFVTPMAYAVESPAGSLSQADLDRAVAQRVGQDDAARGAIRALLHRDEVVAVADGYGLDFAPGGSGGGDVAG